MRLDLFLKISRLIARRNLAQKFCDAGMIKINDSVAKSSREVKAGDSLNIRKGDRVTEIKVLQVPQTKQVSRQDVSKLYEVVSEEILEDALTNL